MKNKKIIIIIIVVIVIILLSFIFVNAKNVMELIGKQNRNKQEIIQNEIDIKSNKDVIYGLFNNFPESNNIYYIFKNLYNERIDIGPTIYQLDIFAELTDEGYNSLIKQLEFQNMQNFEMKINPNNITYNWKNVKDIQIIETKNIEDASIKSIYLDENEKAIYIICIGGN